MLLISGYNGALHAAELPVRIQYPTQVNDVILTGIDGDSVVFRPKGRDRGGRAYLKLDDLLQQGVVLNFLFQQSYYDAVAALDAGQTREALPVLKREVAPFLDYMSLSEIPGNMLPTVLSYLEVLRAAKQWTAATDVATRIPVAIAPALTLDQLRSLSLELLTADEIPALSRLQRHLLSARHLSQDHLEVYVQQSCTQPVSLNPTMKFWKRPFIGFAWLFRKGPGASNHFEAGGFIRSNDEVKVPETLIRVGYTCSKKVGNAVAQNRAKRRLRAAAHEVLPQMGMPGWDYVLVGRKDETAAIDFQQLLNDLRTALSRIHAPKATT